mgnify:CR=1 FL=1
MNEKRTVVPRTAVVTGASSGIGASIVKNFRGRNWRTIGIDRSATSEADRHICVDLTDVGAIETIRSALPSEFDVLCNVAGVPGTAPERTIMDVNVYVLGELTRRLIPRIGPGGAVVNLASLAGAEWREREKLIQKLLGFSDREEAERFRQKELSPDFNVYAFSKECVIVATQQMAAEFLNVGVRAVSVSPGPIDTPILTDFFEDLGVKKVSQAKEIVGRFGMPEDIAELVVAIAADPGFRWVNGVDIVVDGGVQAVRRVTRRQGLEL